jgi:regulator of protease activity HflC (stomatin/prohibitin superfamily)
VEIVAAIAVAGAVIFLVSLAVSAFRRVVDRVTVFEFERGLRYDRGRFVEVLGPGQYWILRSRTTIRPIDIRPRVVTVPGQEVISGDGVSVRVSLTAQYEVTSPAVAINEHVDFTAAFYASLQHALRDIVGQGDIDDLIGQRAEIGAKLREATQEEAARLGLTLLSVEVKDFMFPGELKRIFAQVVSARKEGLAALERARGETAALRNLGNAARMMEAAPTLLQLRLLQELGRTGGNTIVLGFPGGTTPLPLRGEPGAGEIESGDPEDT